MPELPEVETTKNAILPFQGKTLKRIIVNNPSLRWPVDEKAINKIKIQNGNFADDHKLSNKPIKKTKTDIRYVKMIKEIKNDNLANALISIGNYINK